MRSTGDDGGPDAAGTGRAPDPYRRPPAPCGVVRRVTSLASQNTERPVLTFHAVLGDGVPVFGPGRSSSLSSSFLPLFTLLPRRCVLGSSSARGFVGTSSEVEIWSFTTSWSVFPAHDPRRRGMGMRSVW